MSQLLDLINADEFPAIIMLNCILFVAAERLARPDSLTIRRASWIAAAVCLAYIVAGASTWKPATVSEVLLLIVRAGLAAATAFGLSTLVLSLTETVAGVPMASVGGWFKRKAAEARRRSYERQCRRDALERQRLEQEEQERLQPLLEQQRQQDLAEEARRERERFAKTDEARAEVIRFYEEHAALLKDLYPRSLFSTNLQTKFPPSIGPADAWLAAQDIITGMLPSIAEAREKGRIHREEAVKRDEEALKAEQATKDAENRLHAPTRLTEWYDRERSSIEQRLPAGLQRDVVLQELQDRYDELVREAIQEARP